MKKVSLILLLLIYGVCQAQTDTTDFHLDRATNAILYTSQDGGYTLGTGWFDNQGTNILITEATGMVFSKPSNLNVVSVLCWFGYVGINGQADSIDVNLYSLQGDSTVDQLWASASISTADILFDDNQMVLTEIAFPQIAYGLPDDYLVSIEYPESSFNDTIGIMSSDRVAQDGNQERLLRQKSSANFGGVWMSVEDLWGPFDADAFIFPVLQSSVGDEEYYLTHSSIYPNPTSGQIQIQTGGATIEAIQVVNALGELVLSVAGDSVKQSLDLSVLGKGVYYVSVATSESNFIEKVIVQ